MWLRSRGDRNPLLRGWRIEKVCEEKPGLVRCHLVAVLHVGERSAAELVDVKCKQCLLNIANVETSGLSPGDQKFFARRKLPHETTSGVTYGATAALFRISPHTILQPTSASGFADVDDLGLILPRHLEQFHVDRQGFPLVRATDAIQEEMWPRSRFADDYVNTVSRRKVACFKCAKGFPAEETQPLEAGTSPVDREAHRLKLSIGGTRCLTSFPPPRTFVAIPPHADPRVGSAAAEHHVRGAQPEHRRRCATRSCFVRCPMAVPLRAIVGSATARRRTVWLEGRHSFQRARVARSDSAAGPRDASVVARLS